MLFSVIGFSVMSQHMKQEHANDNRSFAIYENIFPNEKCSHFHSAV